MERASVATEGEAPKDEPNFSVGLVKLKVGYTWRVNANRMPTIEEALSVVAEADKKLREKYGG